MTIFEIRQHKAMESLFGFNELISMCRNHRLKKKLAKMAIEDEKHLLPQELVDKVIKR